MISDRNQGGTGSDRNPSGPLYFVSDGGGDLHDISNWERVTFSQFRKTITEACDEFPDLPPDKQEEEKHLALCVHGYNNGFASSIDLYRRVCDSLFSGADSLGVSVLFTWPSKGQVYDYLADRAEARECANDLADVLSNLYDMLARNQVAAFKDPTKACKAKVSILAHSMGNFVTQLALFHAWKRNNRPLATSLVNQLLMIAADVDNNIFDSGEQIGDGDGEGIANLTYRVTALYSGRDPVLAVSAGLKHFFKRRLGRSGLDRTAGNGRPATPDNVWDTDCSDFFASDERDIHGAYFKLDQYASVRTLMREVLCGVDRGVLVNQKIASPNSWWPNKL
jgi:esterase/lipase superfamily enzyme